MKNSGSFPVFFASLLLVGTCLLYPTNLPAAEPGAWRGQSVTEFSPDESKGFAWQIVNDGVMGGLSKGNIEMTDDGTMRFFGDLSLKNNGGFSTVRSEDVDFNLSNDLGLLLRVKGDGRTYEARLDSDARFRSWPVSFAGEFKTTKGKWQEVKVPFSSFKGSFRGQDIPDAVLDPSQIERLGILLADKNEGSFDLEIDWIRTYGKGQGAFIERKKKTDSEKSAKKSDEPARLIATAVADGRFTILKKALDASGLTTFFQWDNPLTVFAPTDEAFAKLPKGTIESLLKPENKDRLVAILSYHVSPGNNAVADSLKSGQLKSVEGTPLEVSFSDGRIRVNDAVLLDGNVQCKDGIIHVIDTVLLPPEPAPKTVVSVAKEAGAFKTLLAAVDAGELTDILKGEGPFTVFAPTDEAFDSLPDGVVASLLKKENRAKLVDVLKYHVISGRVTAGDALNAGKAKGLQGDLVRFRVDDGLLRVNDSTIRSVDLDGGNGIIHVIDAVLLPPAIQKSLKANANSGSEKANSLDAAQTIAQAIEKGVPLYNSGDAKACATVYAECIDTLASSDQFDKPVRDALKATLNRGEQMQSPHQLAWHYRHTLDRVMNHLHQSMN
ncbi:MAG: CIA30 family protein [Verrucomicrobiota bacterium]